MTSMLMVLSMGRGRERKVKGSKRTLWKPHTLHCTTDLSCRVGGRREEGGGGEGGMQYNYVHYAAI